jgi:hypothetical protein
MTAREWLAARNPAPPAPLVEALERVLTSEVPFDTDRLETVAREQLGEADHSPGRVRRSAFSLLLADALFTYACEIALQADDPVAALRECLDTGQAA